MNPHRRLMLDLAERADEWWTTDLFRKPPEPGKTLEMMLRNDPLGRLMVKYVKPEHIQNVRPRISIYNIVKKT